MKFPKLFNHEDSIVKVSAIAGALIINPKIFNDDRGFLYETFNCKTLTEVIGDDVIFVQENYSFSRRWTLRGLHYQIDPAQGKLLSVISGSIYDVLVDLRESSPTYKNWFGIQLKARNHSQLWIPPGIAHGFLCLSEFAEVLYRMTNHYNKESEFCLAWNDPFIDIKWPMPKNILLNISDRDLASLSWDAAPKFSI